MEDNHISDQRARSFVAGLRRFEQDSDPAPFVALFAPDAVTERLDARGERQGEVEQFWREYRDQFCQAPGLMEAGLSRLGGLPGEVVGSV